jgi:hypothetical protein
MLPGANEQAYNYALQIRMLDAQIAEQRLLYRSLMRRGYDDYHDFPRLGFLSRLFRGQRSPAASKSRVR